MKKTYLVLFLSLLSVNFALAKTKTPTPNASPTVTQTTTQNQTPSPTSTQVAYTDHVLLQAGVVAVDPFSITGTAGGPYTITTSESNKVFTELIFRDRVAEMLFPFDSTNLIYSDYSGDFLGGRIVFFKDVEARVGTVLGQEPSSAAVVAGTGDFYGEFNTSAFTIFQNPDPKQQNHPKAYDEVVHTVNIGDMIFGFTTDRGLEAIHKYFGIGLGSEWEIKPANSPSDTQTEFIAGAYLGDYDSPTLGPNMTVASSPNTGFPQFTETHGIICRLDIFYYLDKNKYLTFSGNYNFAIDPGPNNPVEPWSARIGITVPFTDILNAAKNIL